MAENTRPLMVNTTFAPAPEALDHFMHWARNIYMPAVEKSPGCSCATLLRIAAQDPEANLTPNFAIQFRVESPEIGIDWLENRYSLLLAAFFEGHTPEQLPYFTTVMEILQ